MAAIINPLDGFLSTILSLMSKIKVYIKLKDDLGMHSLQGALLYKNLKILKHGHFFKTT